MSHKKKKKKNHPGGRPPKRGRPSKTTIPRIGALGDTIIVPSPPGERKMSEVILEFLEPYLGDWQTEAHFKQLVGLGALAWNTSLFPGAKRVEVLDEMVNSMPPEARLEMRSLFTDMIRRKDTRFASNKRAILNYQVTMTPTGPHLTVLSSLDK
jgi:hypothetical protein